MGYKAKSVSRQWEMWGHELKTHDGKGFEYHHCSPDRRWVEMHRLSEPVVPVVVSESPSGNFLGWIETGTDVPTMIWHERIFDICFPYGSKAEVEAGHGRVVRLELRRGV